MVFMLYTLLLVRTSYCSRINIYLSFSLLRVKKAIFIQICIRPTNSIEFLQGFQEGGERFPNLS